MHALAALGAALMMSMSTAHAAAPAPAACPAGVPAQAISVVNDAYVRPRALLAVEQAAHDQSLQLRAAWGTPCAQFVASGGWTITVTQGCVASWGGGSACQLAGHHFLGGASVQTGTLPYTGWSYAFTHELDEMLVDPSLQLWWRLGLVEVCDPVENWKYALDGVPVTDFVYPSYFFGGSAPFDQMHGLTSAG